MKKKIPIVIIIILSLIIIGLSNLYNYEKDYNGKLLLQLKTHEETIYLYVDSLKMCKDDYYLLSQKLDSVNKLSDFLTQLGKRESNNNYNCVNTLGYLGRWQFNINTANFLMNKKLDSSIFIRSPVLQDTVMFRNMLFNMKVLSKKLNIDSILTNTNYTLSGLLAASHLGGAGSVIKYFKKGINSKDAYNTSIKDYLETFNQF